LLIRRIDHCRLRVKQHRRPWTAHSRTASRTSSFEQAAKVVGVYVGAAYASGFLVISTYLQHFGIRDATPDLFRLRYIHVGVLCLLLPAFVLPAVYLQYKSIRSASNRLFTRTKDFEPVTALAEMLGGTMGLLMAVILYGLLEFSKFEVYRANSATVLVFWAVILILIWLIYTYPVIDRTPFWPTLVRCCLIIAGLIFGAKLIRICFVNVQFPSFIPLSTYLVIVGVCAYYVLLILKEGPAPTHREGISALRIVFLIGLFYLSVLAFANLIFPNIPAEKGGGSLNDLEAVRLCTDYNGLLPPSLVDSTVPPVRQPLAIDVNGKNSYGTTTCSTVVKLIERTSEASIVMAGTGAAAKVYVVNAKVNVITFLPKEFFGKTGSRNSMLSRKSASLLVGLEVFVIVAILSRRKALEAYQQQKTLQDRRVRGS